MGVHCTCGEPDEIKKNTHPKYMVIYYRSFPSRYGFSDNMVAAMY